MLRIGTVPYLNAEPLHRSLQRRADIALIRSVPVLLAQQLAEGACDVALIPIVEHLRGVGQNIISDACIGSSGPVRSVLVFHNRPPNQLRNIAVDADSRTSVAMQQVVLADAFGVHPKQQVLAPDLAAMLECHEAALLIGDRALEARDLALANNIDFIDLGAAWGALTKLPFVYAAWVSRRGLEAEQQRELGELLSAARDDGVKQIGDIARENPTGVQIPAAAIESYLTTSIDHTLTPLHRQGLAEFRRRCQVYGLI